MVISSDWHHVVLHFTDFFLVFTFKSFFIIFNNSSLKWDDPYVFTILVEVGIIPKMGSGLEVNEKSPTKKQANRKNFVKEASPAKTAHDWRKYSNREVLESDGISPVEVEFYDDGTVTFFWCVYLQRWIC